ncbi:MAG: S-layer homology domain-containing protein [Armatimonadetes bacterium]|nr:S-layer homology domain-containing protein [Armatimonadota bacterium]
MRRAAALPVAFVLFLAAPGRAQPFADIPADGWASRALSDLAAAGLIQGYPEGTFRGDRAITRYEAAAIVARLLARAGAVAVPSPHPAPPRGVRRDELDQARGQTGTGAHEAVALRAALTGEISRLERLARDLRGELAAVGIRFDAVEEQLRALKARVDATRVTGEIVQRSEGRRFLQAGQPDLTWANRYRVRVQLTGEVSPQASATVRLTTHVPDASVGGPGVLPPGIDANSRFVNASSDYPLAGALTLDRAYLDLRGPFGVPVWLRVGRQTGVQLGPIGLLLSTGHDSWATISASLQAVDAAIAAFNVSGWEVRALGARVRGGGDAGGWDLWAARVSRALLSKDTLTVGLNYLRSSTHGAGTILFTTGQSLVAGPIVTRDPLGSGWGLDADWTIRPGVSLTAEWANWNHSGSTLTGVTASGLEARLALDLARLGWILPGSPTLTLGYQGFDENFNPWFGAAEDPFSTIFDVGNFKGVNVRLEVALGEKWTLSVLYASGQQASNGRPWSGFDVAAIYPLAERVELLLRYLNVFYADPDFATAEATTIIRAQLTLRW